MTFAYSAKFVLEERSFGELTPLLGLLKCLCEGGMLLNDFSKDSPNFESCFLGLFWVLIGSFRIDFILRLSTLFLVALILDLLMKRLGDTCGESLNVSGDWIL